MSTNRDTLDRLLRSGESCQRKCDQAKIDHTMKLTPTHVQSARRHLRAADSVMKAIIDFSLGRPDVFPHDDLGVRTAIRDRYG